MSWLNFYKYTFFPQVLKKITFLHTNILPNILLYSTCVRNTKVRVYTPPPPLDLRGSYFIRPFFFCLLLRVFFSSTFHEDYQRLHFQDDILMQHLYNNCSSSNKLNNLFPELSKRSRLSFIILHFWKF